MLLICWCSLACWVKDYMCRGCSPTLSNRQLTTEAGYKLLQLRIWWLLVAPLVYLFVLGTCPSVSFVTTFWKNLNPDRIWSFLTWHYSQFGSNQINKMIDKSRARPSQRQQESLHESVRLLKTAMVVPHRHDKDRSFQRLFENLLDLMNHGLD